MLSDLKILDFTSLLPGPYSTMILSDLGATILRVENPTRQDIVRNLPPLTANGSGLHDYINRNKLSISLDLKKQKSIQIIKKIIMKYDILIEGFRPGVMEEFGLDFRSLKEINTSLIYCSLSGYGQDGPLKYRAGHDINYLALSGLASINGKMGLGPILPGIQIADLAGGSLYTVIAVLSAYIHRLITGKGQYIDVAMRDTVASMAPVQLVETLVGDSIPTFEDNLLNGGSYYNYYEAKDGKFLAIGGIEPKFFTQMMDKIGLDKQDYPNAWRNQQLISDLEEKFKEKTQEEWMKLFADVDVCIEPVLDFKQFKEHPQTKARDLIITNRENNQKQYGHPIKYSQFSPSYQSIGPKKGEDNQKIMKEFGYSQEEIDKLMRERIFG